MQRNKSLINGAGFEPPVVVGAPVPRDVTGDAMREGVARSAANMGGLFREMVRTEDFTKQLEQEKTLMQARNQADIESTRRLMLPDGDEEAFFDDRGNFKEVAVKDFVAPYRKILGGMGSGIQDPERAMKMRFKAGVAGDEMLGSMIENGLKASKQKQEQSFKDYYDLALSQGDYASARDIVEQGRGVLFGDAKAQKFLQGCESRALDDAVSLSETMGDHAGAVRKIREAQERNILGADKANEAIYRIDQKALSDDLSDKIEADANDAFKRIQLGEFNAMRPDVLRRAKMEVERRLQRECSPIPLTRKDQQDSAKGKIVQPKYNVRNGATEQEYKWRAIHNATGSYAPVAGEVRSAWSDEVDNAPIPKDENEAEKWMNDLCKKYCDPSTGYGADENDVRPYAEEKMNVLLGRVDDSTHVDAGRFVEAFNGQDVFPHIYKNSSKNDAAVKAKMDELRIGLTGDVVAWRKNNPQASYSAQVKALSSMMSVRLKDMYSSDKYDGNAPKDSSIEARALSKDLRSEGDDGELQRQGSDHKAWIERNRAYNPQSRPMNRIEALDAYNKRQKVFDVTCSTVDGAEAGVYVSPSVYNGLREKMGEKPWVELTTRSGAFVRVPVLGAKDGVDANGVSVTTAACQKLASFDPGRVKARFVLGEAPSEKKDVTDNGNMKSPQSSQSKSAEMIIGNEARRDKKGNLSVYKLPAGDGGGTHEIAGINNGSHPKEFAKLKGMINSGDHKGAEQEAQRYIMKYTQPVGNALDSAGVKSAGISHFLRDMHFNSGEYGVARVICRAMGIPDSKKLNNNTSEAMKNYLKTHTEDELLDALKGSRENLYKSIASNNSEKQQFLRGWINRNNKAYKQAKGMA